MKYIYISLLSILTLNFTFSSDPINSGIAHEFHVSKCMLEYNEKNKSLEIILHIFIDDLEEAIRQQGKDKLFIGTEKEATDANTYIMRYLNQRFEVSVNRNKLNYNWIGKENSDDLAAIWCYLEIENVNNIQELKIQNDVLMDIFDDQKNIISITGPEKKKGYFMFEKGKSNTIISYE